MKTEEKSREKNTTVPEFAILGHPNEGKSSVVSTLSEDDSVKVSDIPGETVVCRSYPVKLDGEEVLRFVDTPGFQMPTRTLKWFENYSGDSSGIIHDFISAHRDNRLFRDECELLSPLIRGAGVIYVVDGSRPVRDVDRAEMEILRLTGRPRMAIINSKNQGSDHTAQWKMEFRRSFNSIRVFNAARATYPQRMALLESLKSIDQDWEPVLSRLIKAFINEWESRNRASAIIITRYLEKALCLSVSEPCDDESAESEVREKILSGYRKIVTLMEQKAQQEIRDIFRHRIYTPTLPEQSILREGLFDEKTWNVLGLSRKQLVAAAAACGSAAAVLLDLAVAGSSFGAFAAVGGLVGAGSALIGGKRMATARVSGMALGGHRLTVGPNENIQFLYVLLDRILLYYAHLIHRAHGSRDGADTCLPAATGRSFSSAFSAERKDVCNRFFTNVKKRSSTKKNKAVEEMENMVGRYLNEIST